MSRHLNDHEIAAALSGLELEATAESHRAECLLCRQRVRDLERLLEARRAELAAGAPDWRAQREAVLARLPARPAPPVLLPARRWLRPVLAIAATVVVVVGLGLLWRGAAPPADEPLPVADILAEAEALLASDEIPGFAVIDPGLDTLSTVAANGHS